MDRECLYPGHPDTCTPWHYLELDGGRRIVTRVLVKVWRHRHPETTSGDLAVVSFDAVGEAQRLVQEPQFSVVVHEAPQSGLESPLVIRSVDRHRAGVATYAAGRMIQDWPKCHRVGPNDSPTGRPKAVLGVTSYTS